MPSASTSMTKEISSASRSGLDDPIGRRAFLRGAGSLGLAGLVAPLAACLPSGPTSSPASPRASFGPRTTPIKQVIVDVQENRSFDHYYGYAPFVGKYGVPAGFKQPDGFGAFVTPYRLNALVSHDIGHSWVDTQHELDGGKMDGFFSNDGR